MILIFHNWISTSNLSTAQNLHRYWLSNLDGLVSRGPTISNRYRRGALKDTAIDMIDTRCFDTMLHDNSLSRLSSSYIPASATASFERAKGESGKLLPKVRTNLSLRFILGHKRKDFEVSEESSSGSEKRKPGQVRRFHDLGRNVR